MTRPGGPNGKDGWWLALPALAIVCCAGPALLVTLGAGSVGALLGGVTGSVMLACAGLLLVIAAVLVLRRRVRR